MENDPRVCFIATATATGPDGNTYTDTHEAYHYVELPGEEEDGQWIWAEDGTSATAILHCRYRGGHDMILEATVTEQSRKDATATEDGWIEYQATAYTQYYTADSWQDLYVRDTKTVVIPAGSAHEHRWELREWNWSEDLTSAWAFFQCAYDDSHVQQLDAEITRTVTKKPTEEEEGIATYTATLVFEGMIYTDDVTQPIPKLTPQEPTTTSLSDVFLDANNNVYFGDKTDAFFKGTIDTEAKRVVLYQYLGEDTAVVIPGKALYEGEEYLVYISDSWSRFISTDAPLKELTFAAVDGQKVQVVEESFGDARLSRLFYDCGYLRKADLSGLDVSNVTHAGYMLANNSALTEVNLAGWDTGKMTDMSGMFSGCSNLKDLDVSRLDTSSAVNLSSMFSGCKALTSIDVSGFDTSSATDLSSMFSNCRALTSIDVSGFDTSSVTNLYAMFSYCDNLTTLNVSAFKTNKVSNFSYMFMNCGALTSLDLTGWNTERALNMAWMFYGLNSMESLDLSSFDVSSAGASSAFIRGDKIQTVITPKVIGDLFSGGLGTAFVDDEGHGFEAIDETTPTATALHRHSHTWSFKELIGTCEDGTVVEECSGCDMTRSYAASGHVSSGKRTGKKATFTEDGYWCYKCDLCGEELGERNVVRMVGTAEYMGFDDTFKYNGSVQKPVIGFIVKENGDVIEQNAFTLSYENENSTEPGIYKMTLTLKGLYEGTREFTYEILPGADLETPVITKTRNVNAGIEITWGAVDGADRYILMYKTDDGYWDVYEGGETTATKFVMPKSDLKSGTRYWFSICAEKEDGTDLIRSGSSTAKAQTYMATPVVTKTRNVNAGIEVTWGSVTGATSYILMYKPDGGSWKTYKSGITATKFVVPKADLKSGTKYWFTVKAKGNATSGYSSGKAQTYMTTPAVTKTRNVNAGVEVTWGKVTGATSYVLMYRTADSGWMTYKSGITATKYVVSRKDLSSSTKYWFTVKAKGAATSGYSSGKAQTYIEAPTMYEIMNRSNGFMVIWSPVDGAKTYTLMMKVSGGNWTTVKTGLTSNVYTIPKSKLTSGKTYYFTAKAVGAATSGYSSGLAYKV